MSTIATSSPTAGLTMDVNTGVLADLSLDDFEDEDLSDILHDSSDIQLHSYSNDNFKIGRKPLLLGRRRTRSSKKKETKELHRSYSVSDANNPLKGTVCRRPRPTTLNFFAEPARPGPLPMCYFLKRENTQSTLHGHSKTETESSSTNNNPSSETRLKPTFSDETIKNNNTETVEENHNCHSRNTSVENGNGGSLLNKVDTSTFSTTNPPTDSSAKTRNNSTLNLSSTLPRHSRYSSGDVTKSIRCSELTRSASEWSIEDPGKVECCFFNGKFKEQTHTASFKFIPRHDDEIQLEINDPLHVVNEADDFWYEGINMRTGQQGIFPSYYAQSLLDLEDKMSEMSFKDDQSEQFNVYFLGSVEVACHKGNDILCQAMHKVAQARRATVHKLPPAFVCLMVSLNAIKMMDQSQLRRQQAPDNPYCSFSSSLKVKQHTHYFHLRNVSFCGHHPKNDKYFAFITRHPQSPSRFACHVFVSDVSTRPLAESIGRAFEAFYHEFMNNSHPAEDIYIE